MTSEGDIRWVVGCLGFLFIFAELCQIASILERIEKAIRSKSNFPSTSQNQTVSSGVEGAHEGTTVDKSDD